MQPDMKTTLGPGVAVLPGGGGIFKSAAVAVLRMERRLMTTGEITRCVSWSRALAAFKLLSGASHVALPQLVRLPEPQHSLNIVHMACDSCCRVALTRGLINCQGKTPEATMASALYTDVKRKQGASVFTRPQVILPADSCSSPAQQQGQQQGAAGGDGGLVCVCRRASLGCGSGMQRALCQTTTCWWMWRWGTSHPLSRGSGQAPG